MQMRNEGVALATAMDEDDAVIEYRQIHEDLQRLRTSIAVVDASLSAEGAAADDFRAQVLEVVRGTEETMWQLRINAARRAVVAAHVWVPAALWLAWFDCRTSMIVFGFAARELLGSFPTNGEQSCSAFARLPDITLLSSAQSLQSFPLIQDTFRASHLK
jgi:hypothetical protein